MAKLTILAFALTVFCFGIWETVLAVQYPGFQNDWPTVDGWLCDHGEALQLPGRAKILNLLLAQPYVGFVYNVDGAMYYKRQELPTCLALFCPRQELAVIRVGDTDSGQCYFTCQSNQLAKFDPNTRKLEVLTEEGMTISSNYGTSHLGQKWEEVPQSSWETYLPRIKIRYKRHDPQQSFTDQDYLNGKELLMKSGLTAIVSAILIAGAVILHAWLTREDPVAEAFPRRR